MEFQLEEFNPKKKEIEALARECQGLSIDGIEDKAGYQLVHEKRMLLKSKRVEIKKTAKEMRDGANKFAKAVINLEKDLVALIEPTERDLEAKQNAIDEEKEKIKRRASLPDRIERLDKLGVSISEDELLEMDDKAFDEFYLTKKQEYLDEQERRLADEREKIEKEKREEEDRKRREAELEKAREEAADMARAEERKRLERETNEREERIKREAEEEKNRILREQEERERARVEKEEQERREAEDKKQREEEEDRKRLLCEQFQGFLHYHQYSEETDILRKNGDEEVILYRKVASFKRKK